MKEKEELKKNQIINDDSHVKLINVNKIYDKNVHAVHDFNLDIKRKEFIVFVGPSGCGKSTTLRMIAGLETISSGELYIDGVLSNDIYPKDRNIAMVFQSYALYPNMTVFDNLAFSLSIKHLPKEEINKKVHEAAKTLEIEDLLDRKPKQLSGGQRQRVALGRTIVRDTRLFLMDEPLSNLDAKLRVQMRAEIIKLHKTVGATTIYVTHDQTEAMTMADRIIVMKDGYIQQIGTPYEIYRNPVNKFVASFIGSPAMNFTDVLYDNGSIVLNNTYKIKFDKDTIKKHDIFYVNLLEKLKKDKEELLNLPEKVEKKKWNLFKKKKNVKTKDDILSEINKKIEEVENIIKTKKHNICIGIRPESIKIATPEDKKVIKVPVNLSELLGDEYFIHFEYNRSNMLSKIPSDVIINSGEEINLKIIEESIHIFDPISDIAIR